MGALMGTRNANEISIANPSYTHTGTYSTLDQHISDPIAHSGNRTYEAIVAASGGDYTTIAAAVSAGKTSIYVRKGTYSLSGNMEIGSGVTIVGENPEDTIIDCNTYTWWSEGYADDWSKYATGTVTFTHDDETVTGSGTDWDPNIAAGDYIRCFDEWIEIASVTDDTHLEMVEPWRGATTAGVTYQVSTFKKNLIFRNLQFIDGPSAVGCIYLRWVKDVHIENCYFRDCPSYSVLGSNVGHSRFVNNKTDNSTHGIIVNKDSVSNLWQGNSLRNCSGSGFGDGGDGYIAGAANVYIDNIVENSGTSGNAGIYCYYSDRNIVVGNFILGMDGSGIVLHDSDYSIVNNNISVRNNAYGIRLQNTSDYGVCIGNVAKNNTTAEVSNTGTGWVIDHNQTT